MAQWLLNCERRRCALIRYGVCVEMAVLVLGLCRCCSRQTRRPPVSAQHPSRLLQPLRWRHLRYDAISPLPQWRSDCIDVLVYAVLLPLSLTVTWNNHAILSLTWLLTEVIMTSVSSHVVIMTSVSSHVSDRIAWLCGHCRIIHYMSLLLIVKCHWNHFFCFR